MPTAATTGSQFAVLVTTRSLEEDARVISQGLVRQGFSSDVYPWSIGGDELFDVYVTSLESMADAADVAERLSAGARSSISCRTRTARDCANA